MLPRHDAATYFAFHDMFIIYYAYYDISMSPSAYAMLMIKIIFPRHARRFCRAPRERYTRCDATRTTRQELCYRRLYCYYCRRCYVYFTYAMPAMICYRLMLICLL